MKKRIKVELQKMFHTRGFWFGIIIALLFSVADFTQQAYDFSAYHYGNSVFEKWMAMPYDTYASSIFYLIYPVLASLPYAWSMAEELRTGYVAQVFVREKRSHYFTGKFIAAFLSGGIAIDSALALNLYLLTLLQKTTYSVPYYMTSGFIPGSFCSTLYYEKPVAFALIWLCVSFLWGGAFAVLCCSLGFFLRRKLYLVPAMLVIYILQSLVAEMLPIYRWFYRIHMGWFDLTRADTMGLNPEWAVIGNIALIVLLSIMIMYIKGKKYEAV